MYSPELDHDSDWSEWPPWGYKRGGPDPQWAIITAGFAGAIGVGLVLKHFKGRSWYMAPAIAAQFGLTMLLLTRFISGSEWTHIAYAFDRLIMTLCACVFMSTNYAIIGKLATALHVDKYLVRSTTPLSIYGSLDAAAFGIQGLAILLASAESTEIRYRSYQVLQAGIILQFVSFTYFMGTLALWLKRVSYYEREVWQSSSTMITTEGDEDEQVASDEPALATRSELLGRWWKDWRTLVAAVVFSLTALYFRLAYRIFRSRQNFRNDRFYWETMSENQDNWYELVPILLSVAVFTVVWPASYIEKDEKPKQAEETLV